MMSIRRRAQANEFDIYLPIEVVDGLLRVLHRVVVHEPEAPASDTGHRYSTDRKHKVRKMYRGHNHPQAEKTELEKPHIRSDSY